MEFLPVLSAMGRELGTPVVMVVLFIGVIIAAQRAFGGTFEHYRAEAVSVRNAQAETNKTMLGLIEQMREEISAISIRLVECQRQHKEDRIMIEAQEQRLYRLQIALAEKGIQFP
jgi:hypothetical protein